MADDIAVTPGSGATIAADEVSSSKHQRIKFGLGADGSANDALGGSGTVADGVRRAVLATDVALPASEVHLGEVGGRTPDYDLTMSLDTNPYAAGDVLAATQQADAFFRKADGTGVIASLTVIDEDDQKADFDVYFFSGNASLGTENGAPSISDADARTVLGFVSVAGADYIDLGGVSIARVRNLSIPVKAASGTDDLYVGIVNGSATPTYTASGLTLRIGAILD